MLLNGFLFIYISVGDLTSSGAKISFCSMILFLVVTLLTSAQWMAGYIVVESERYMLLKRCACGSILRSSR